MNVFKKVVTAVVAVSVGAMICSCGTTSQSTKSAFVPKKVEVPVTVTFPSQDGIPVTADLYMAYDKSAPLILLCHRANWSRGEYLEIAPKLNMLGFNAIAIDQRSGKTKNNIDNATKLAAEGQGKGTTYLDALQDMNAAIDFACSKTSSGKIILWGSSYSSSLGFTLLEKNKNRISGYLAFSPGEYFKDFGKAENWIASEAASVTIPVFITSKKSEKDGVQPIFDALKSKNKTYYVPEHESKHGSQGLYEATEGHEKTWTEVEKFLKNFR